MIEASFDSVIFGDNQFFGVNHMSEEKARAQAMRFQDIERDHRRARRRLRRGRSAPSCARRTTGSPRSATTSARTRTAIATSRFYPVHAVRAQVRERRRPSTA